MKIPLRRYARQLSRLLRLRRKWRLYAVLIGALCSGSLLFLGYFSRRDDGGYEKGPARRGGSTSLRSGYQPAVLEEGHTVSGTVVTANGNRIAAEVILQHRGQVVRRMLAPDGSFQFTGVNPGYYVILAEADDFAVASVNVSLVNDDNRHLHVALVLQPCSTFVRAVVRGSAAGRAWVEVAYGANRHSLSLETETVDICLPRNVVVALRAFATGSSSRIHRLGVSSSGATVTLVLEPDASVLGHAVAEDGQGVPGEVVLRSNEAELRMMTDSTGRFLFENVRYGTYELSMTGSTHASIHPSVVVIAPESQEPVLLRVEDAAVVAGRVVDRSGAAVADASVEFLSTRVPGHSISAKTNADGSFRLSGCPRGQGEFAVIPHALVSPREFTVNEKEHFVELHVERGFSLSGRVVREGSAFVGVDVDVRAASGELAIAVQPEIDGSFFIDGLSSGTYEVAVKLPTGGVAAAAQIDVGADSHKIELIVERGAKIDGHLRTRSGLAVPNYVVRAHARDADSISAVAFSAMDGSFTFEDVIPGHIYSVSASPALGDSSSAVSRDHTVDVPVAMDYDVGDIVIEGPQWSLRGIVVDADRMPIAGASVEFEGGSGVFREMETELSGRFEFDGLYSACCYTVRAKSLAGNVIMSGIAAGHDEIVLALPPTSQLTVERPSSEGAVQVAVVRGDESIRREWTTARKIVLDDIPRGHCVVVVGTPSAWVAVPVHLERPFETVALSEPEMAEIRVVTGDAVGATCAWWLDLGEAGLIEGLGADTIEPLFPKRVPARRPITLACKYGRSAAWAKVGPLAPGAVHTVEVKWDEDDGPP